MKKGEIEQAAEDYSIEKVPIHTSADKECRKFAKLDFISGANHVLSKLSWRKIDPDNLPEESVFATDFHGNHDIVWGKHFIKPRWDLYTHYIEVSELLKLHRE